MTTLFVLDVPENVPVVHVAAADPAVTIGRIGPYFEISSPVTIVIDRRATGVRHAVWYSSVAGLGRSRITQHDKDSLRVESLVPESLVPESVVSESVVPESLLPESLVPESVLPESVVPESLVLESLSTELRPADPR